MTDFLHFAFPGLPVSKEKELAREILESLKGGSGSGNFGHAGRPGEIGGSAPGGVGIGGSIHNVITETDAETAKILITQGLEPSFKPQIAEGYEYAPGIGLEREGTYVANPNAFSKGSFGSVRIYMDIGEENLTIPKEQSQLGTTDINKALSNENGAITKGRVSPKSITKVEVREGNQWKQYSRDEYIKKNNLTNIPELPSISNYRAALNRNKDSWRLRDDQIDDLVFDYNRGDLYDKINLAQEVGLID